ncbi:sucrase ferredoxin [Georgenia sp. SYP-B2076]|uniref:sucrase ferredoxin n=1 Tax=Georgenia sp. SYP-B2076 TaxID=2495881 RepID=UPI000F8DFA9F|nr:sucrase ferredoxin [Georgenia sp. SYP-B2076]
MISTRPQACSRLSVENGDPLAGTASTARGFLLVEHGGPWGKKPLRDAVFRGPGGAHVDLGGNLGRVLEPLGVTALLVRRPGARHGIPSPATVMLVAVDQAGGRGARTSVEGVSEILGWDVPGLLGELRTGRTPAGWRPLGTQYLACTHARRDACCGELGRPVARALGDVEPARTWEVSHLGGHRLAANVLVVPDGVVYGRLGAADAPALVRCHDEGRLLLGALRGRAALPQPVQAAEIAVRRAAGAEAADGAALLSAEVQGARTLTRWRVGRTAWRVVVETVADEGAPRPASCGAEPSAPPARQVVLEVTAGG